MTEPVANDGRLPENVRNWAMVCHLSALAMLVTGIGALVGPLIVWLLKRDVDPFIDDQGKEALNFQITMMIAAIVSAILTLVIVGFLFLVIVGLLMLIMPIVAATKSSDGELYRYPMTIRFIK